MQKLQNIHTIIMFIRAAEIANSLNTLVITVGLALIKTTH